LNAEDIPKEQVNKVAYRIVRNNRFFEQTEETACYSYTAIAEISVFALGKAENVPTSNMGENSGNPNLNQTDTNGGVTVKIVPVVFTSVVAVALIGISVVLKVKKNKQD
jgi:hypothetical protein